MKKKKIFSLLLDGGSFILGGAVYGLALNMFMAPNNIAPGGFSGVSTLLHYLFGTPIGVMIMVLNLPLFIWAIVRLGWQFTAKTIGATLGLSLMIDLMALFVTPYQGNTLLAALYGGVLSGTGLSLFFMRGATTGGSDLLAKMIQGKFRHLSMGNLILLVDIVIIAAAVVVYRNIENGLYAMVTIFVSTKVIDALLYGLNTGRLMFIVTQRADEIKSVVMERVSRGVTEISAKGAYTGSQSPMLMCAVKRSEVFKIRDIVKEADPKAFIIISEANEIIGEGFGDIEKQM